MDQNLSKTVFTFATVIMPVINEVTSLIETIDIILDRSDENINEIVLVVCQKTTKQSLSACHLLKSRHTDKVIIHWQRLPFLGGALREGLNIAQGSHAIIMYSDAESDPKSVEDLIIEAKKHPIAIISASRWLGGSSFENYPVLKDF